MSNRINLISFNLLLPEGQQYYLRKADLRLGTIHWIKRFIPEPLSTSKEFNDGIQRWLTNFISFDGIPT